MFSILLIQSMKQVLSLYPACGTCISSTELTTSGSSFFVLPIVLAAKYSSRAFNFDPTFVVLIIRLEKKSKYMATRGECFQHMYVHI